jgi:hypothetical protein
MTIWPLKSSATTSGALMAYVVDLFMWMSLPNLFPQWGVKKLRMNETCNLACRRDLDPTPDPCGIRMPSPVMLVRANL